MEAKLIAKIVGIVLLLLLLQTLLPYIVIFLAMVGAWYFWQEAHKP